jgi:hypothetical protein
VRLHDVALFGYKKRLLTLARRPALQREVETATAGLLHTDAPSSAAIQMRAGVLEAERNKDELAQEFEQLVARTQWASLG